MHGMLNRMIESTLAEVIPRVPAVALLGPRQIGKTTLAQVVGKAHQSLYLDLESPEDIIKLRIQD